MRQPRDGESAAGLRRTSHNRFSDIDDVNGVVYGDRLVVRLSAYDFDKVRHFGPKRIIRAVGLVRVAYPVGQERVVIRDDSNLVTHGIRHRDIQGVVTANVAFRSGIVSTLGIKTNHRAFRLHRSCRHLDNGRVGDPVGKIDIVNAGQECRMLANVHAQQRGGPIATEAEVGWAAISGKHSLAQLNVRAAEAENMPGHADHASMAE